jgi:BolA family transcriptional regulator, general stress-responsive regulator
VSDRVASIRALLEDRLAPAALSIEDDSHLHAGHAGAAGGAGHFTVRIVSERFEGMVPVARHRLVYQSVAPLMSTEIHALAIVARTPAEDAMQATARES